MTAVEWFYQRILAKDINAVFEQAKEMEKEQIIDAFENGKEKMEQFQDEIPDEDETIYLMYGSEYYNETFKSE
jgi:hypothetical protein